MMREIRALAAATVLAAASLAAAQDPQALPRMVATERAFAAATGEIGVRDAFLVFFADDAVRIEAGATGADTVLHDAAENFRKQPLQPLPLEARLTWSPHTGQISSDGTLGWLTGPYVVTNLADSSVLGQGAYFTVWKRQDDGTFRVWLDEGVALAEAWGDASEFVAAPVPSGGTGGAAAETAAEVEAAVAAGGGAWHARWSDAVRVHRHQRMPIVGRSAAGAWAGIVWPEVSFHVARLEVAASDDLAVAIGGYEAKTAGGSEHGTWVRVWTRDASGLWRIVFETSKAAM
jgi:ketosteroid isomerase-like protein